MNLVKPSKLQPALVPAERSRCQTAKGMRVAAGSTSGGGGSSVRRHCKVLAGEFSNEVPIDMDDLIKRIKIENLRSKREHSTEERRILGISTPPRRRNSQRSQASVSLEDTRQRLHSFVQRKSRESALSRSRSRSLLENEKEQKNLCRSLGGLYFKTFDLQTPAVGMNLIKEE